MIRYSLLHAHFGTLLHLAHSILLQSCTYSLCSCWINSYAKHLYRMAGQSNFIWLLTNQKHACDCLQQSHPLCVLGIPQYVDLIMLFVNFHRKLLAEIMADILFWEWKKKPHFLEAHVILLYIICVVEDSRLPNILFSAAIWWSYTSNTFFSE